MLPRGRRCLAKEFVIVTNCAGFINEKMGALDRGCRDAAQRLDPGARDPSGFCSVAERGVFSLT